MVEGAILEKDGRGIAFCEEGVVLGGLVSGGVFIMVKSFVGSIGGLVGDG